MTTTTLPKPVLNRLQRTAAGSTASREQVEGLLYDIAAVLRLTAKVKGEMLREQGDEDRKLLEAHRAAAAARLPQL